MLQNAVKKLYVNFIESQMDRKRKKEKICCWNT